MFPVPQKGSSDEKRLLNAFTALSDEGRQALLDYADFLVERYPGEPAAATDPLDIPRPEEESVIAAIKRLSSSFPMLDTSVMLHETSGLMSQHLLQGRDAVEVIDELEVLFRRHYDKRFGNGD